MSEAYGLPHHPTAHEEHSASPERSLHTTAVPPSLRFRGGDYNSPSRKAAPCGRDRERDRDRERETETESEREREEERERERGRERERERERERDVWLVVSLSGGYAMGPMHQRERETRERDQRERDQRDQRETRERS